MYYRTDPKSGNKIYVVRQQDFHHMELSSIPLSIGWDKINVHAAQHDYMGTVVLPHDTKVPVLFLNVSIEQLLRKASSEGLYRYYEEQKMHNELAVFMVKGGGHFFSILSNQSHHVYADLYPDSHDEEKESSLYNLSHLLSFLFGSLVKNHYRTDDCKLDHHKDLCGFSDCILDDLVAIHEGVAGFHNVDNIFSNIYNEQFNSDLKRPVLGEYAIRFKITDWQYRQAFEAIKALDQGCISKDIGYSPLPKQGDKSKIENCVTSLNSIVEASGINTPYMKFFLDFELLFDSSISSRHFYHYKIGSEYPLINLVTSYINPLSISMLAVEFLSLKYIAPDFKYSPYIALLSNVAEYVHSLLLNSGDREERPYLKDTSFIVVPCYKYSIDSCMLPANTANPFEEICIIDDRGFVYKVIGNDKGNFERITMCKDTVVEYDLSTIGSSKIPEDFLNE